MVANSCLHYWCYRKCSVRIADPANVYCYRCDSTVKVWLSYYAIVMTNWQRHVYDELIQLMAKWGRLLVWIMLFFMVLSQVVDIGMTASARYGIRSFQFVYNVPGNFSKMFYFLIPLLTADLCYKSTLYKKLLLRELWSCGLQQCDQERFLL